MLVGACAFFRGGESRVREIPEWSNDRGTMEGAIKFSLGAGRCAQREEGKRGRVSRTVDGAVYRFRRVRGSPMAGEIEHASLERCLLHQCGVSSTAGVRGSSARTWREATELQNRDCASWRRTSWSKRWRLAATWSSSSSESPDKTLRTGMPSIVKGRKRQPDCMDAAGGAREAVQADGFVALAHACDLEPYVAEVLAADDVVPLGMNERVVVPVVMPGREAELDARRGSA